MSRTSLADLLRLPLFSRRAWRFTPPAHASLATVMVCTWLCACDTRGESCGIDSKDIALDVRVIDDPMGIVVIAELSERTDSEVGIPIELCAEPQEKLTINGKPEQKEKFEGVSRYVRPFADPAPEYEVRFEREDDTYTAVVPAAPPFQITDPKPNSMLSRQMPITVRWDAGNPERMVLVKIEREDLLCLDSFETMAPDTGEYVISESDHNLTASDAGPECDASVVVTRRNEAAAPAGLHPDSSLEAIVRRSVRFVSVP